jgi:hypothetical protein
VIERLLRGIARFGSVLLARGVGCILEDLGCRGTALTGCVVELVSGLVRLGSAPAGGKRQEGRGGQGSG